MCCEVLLAQDAGAVRLGLAGHARPTGEVDTGVGMARSMARASSFDAGRANRAPQTRVMHIATERRLRTSFGHGVVISCDRDSDLERAPINTIPADLCKLLDPRQRLARPRQEVTVRRTVQPVGAPCLFRNVTEFPPLEAPF